VGERGGEVEGRGFGFIKPSRCRKQMMVVPYLEQIARYSVGS